MSLFNTKPVLGTGKTILAFPNRYECIAQTISLNGDHSALLAKCKSENGRTILKAGTVFPSNDEHIKGVVFQDYDVTDNKAPTVSLLIRGTILSKALPEAIEHADKVPAITIL